MDCKCSDYHGRNDVPIQEESEYNYVAELEVRADEVDVHRIDSDKGERFPGLDISVKKQILYFSTFMHFGSRGDRFSHSEKEVSKAENEEG